MAMTHNITSPADLAEVYRSHAGTCQAAANSARAKSERDLWEAQAKVWEHAAGIAAASTFKPEAS